MWVPRSYDEIDQAIGSAEETTQVDFKEELGTSREIAKDIASMTIDGGVLLYGVKEKDAVAIAITPVPLANAPERIQQIANSAVDPLPAIDIAPLRANPTDDTGVVVVIVEASPLAPHMANDRYPARSGTTTRYLAQPEVERLYEQRRGFVAVEGLGVRSPDSFRLQSPALELTWQIEWEDCGSSLSQLCRRFTPWEQESVSRWWTRWA